MDLDPVEIGRVARAWDEQHLELAAAGHQIGGAAATGFSVPVAGVARRFATDWGRATAAMGETCEARADSMRLSVRLAVGADNEAADGLSSILAAVAERR